MDRRKFVIAIGTGVFSTGCSGVNDQDVTTTTERTTKSATSITTTPSITTEESATTETTTASPTTEESTTVTTPNIEIERVVVPETASIGEQFKIDVHVENSGNGDGIWESEIFDTATRGTKPKEIDTTYSTWEPNLVVPAGESVVWESPYISYIGPCNAYFQVGFDKDIYETQIPGNKAPILQRANVVSGWENFGDVIENTISVGESNSTIEFGFRFWYYEQQSFEVFEQVEIRDGDGDRVGLNQTSGEQLTENSGWNEWENALTFDTTDWKPGTYTGEVLIRDENTDTVSGGFTTEFEIVDDLSDLKCTDAVVISSDWPEQEPGNEPYDDTPESLDVTLKNTADTGGEVTLETRWGIYGVLVKRDRDLVEIGAGETKEVTVESTPPREGSPVWHQVVYQDCNY